MILVVPYVNIASRQHYRLFHFWDDVAQWNTTNTSIARLKRKSHNQVFEGFHQKFVSVFDKNFRKRQFQAVHWSGKAAGKKFLYFCRNFNVKTSITLSIHCVHGFECKTQCTLQFTKRFFMRVQDYGCEICFGQVSREGMALENLILHVVCMILFRMEWKPHKLSAENKSGTIADFVSKFEKMRQFQWLALKRMRSKKTQQFMCVTCTYFCLLLDHDFL